MRARLKRGVRLRQRRVRLARRPVSGGEVDRARTEVWRAVDRVSPCRSTVVRLGGKPVAVLRLFPYKHWDFRGIMSCCAAYAT